MAISKIVYGSTVLLDLTGDTVTASDLALGVSAHKSDGEAIVGTSTKDADTRDATAGVSEILSGRTAYVNGSKLIGTMPNRGGVSGVIDEASGAYEIPNGYHDGSGKVVIAASEKEKLIPSNIKSGVEILGVVGEYASSTVSAQSKTVIPRRTSQIILPDAGYDYLSQVNIEAIPYTETENVAGGITVTIGASGE